MVDLVGCESGVEVEDVPADVAGLVDAVGADGDESWALPDGAEWIVRVDQGAHPPGSATQKRTRPSFRAWSAVLGIDRLAKSVPRIWVCCHYLVVGAPGRPSCFV